jgi:hypothetical protein
MVGTLMTPARKVHQEGKAQEGRANLRGTCARLRRLNQLQPAEGPERPRPAWARAGSGPGNGPGNGPGQSRRDVDPAKKALEIAPDSPICASVPSTHLFFLRGITWQSPKKKPLAFRLKSNSCFN